MILTPSSTPQIFIFAGVTHHEETLSFMHMVVLSKINRLSVSVTREAALSMTLES